MSGIETNLKNPKPQKNGLATKAGSRPSSLNCSVSFLKKNKWEEKIGEER